MRKIFFITILFVSLVFILPVFANQQLSPATFNTSTNTIHIPYFALGRNNYWLDLKLAGNNPLQFKIVNYGQNANVGNCEACATYDVNNQVLLVPYFEFNGNKYWLTFKLQSTKPIIFTFLSFGASQINEQKTYTDPVTGMEFVNIKGGCFQMGDTFGNGWSNESPVHKVCVSNFYIGKYEVTQGQWKKVMGKNPANNSYCGDNCPVEKVSWNNAQEFISRLNNQTGKSFRLPTEAEWEYAARSGGKKEKYSGSNDVNAVAWYYDNSGRHTHPVGQKQANGLGIYDMSGNVYEWCLDWYDEDYYGSSPTNNPQGPSSGSYHVLRGGGWFDDAFDARTTRRDRNMSKVQSIHYGFRLSLSAN